MIHRRNLCQALAALALAGLSSPFQKLAAAEAHVEPTSHAQPDRVQADEKKLRICILRRQSHGGLETFLLPPDGVPPDADSAEKTMAGRA